MAPLRLDLTHPSEGEPAVKPPVFEHGMEAIDPNYRPPVKPVQFAQPSPVANPPATLPSPNELPPPGSAALGPLPVDATLPPPGTRRVRLFPRSDSRMQAQWLVDPTGTDYVGVFSSG